MTTYHSRDGVTSRLRMRGHDYSSSSSYFITACAEGRICLFSDICDGAARLTPAGAMIDSWWHFIPSRFSSVVIDAMVVMPNHLHAVLHIGTDPGVTSTPTLSDVLQWFKIRTTYDYTLGVKTDGWSRFPGKLWQTGYYDHILRNDQALEKVRLYITGNPRKWEKDEYNPRELA